MRCMSGNFSSKSLLIGCRHRQAGEPSLAFLLLTVHDEDMVQHKQVSMGEGKEEGGERGGGLFTGRL